MANNKFNARHGLSVGSTPIDIVDDTGTILVNSPSATKLSTARTISITGDISYTSGSFDGTGNVTGAATLATVNSNIGTFNNVTVNAKGLVTAASNTTYALPTDVHYIGTTSVALNRASANLALTGISSVALPGSTSGTITLTPAAVAGTTAITIPATAGTLVTTGDTGTVTSTMILDGTIVNADINASAAIAVSKLAASTISGITLGNNLATLTIGTGLSGTSYNGSTAITIAIDSTVATLTGTQTLTNKTLTSPVISSITNTGTITIPTTTGTLALQGDTHYIGTTAVTLNRASANLALTGISSVTLPGSTSGTVQIIPTAIAGTGTVLTLPATTGTVVTTGDTGTVTNTMLAGSIANAKLVNSSVTVGTTSISLGASSTTLAGLTSVTSTTFVGALTGNASTATALAIGRTISLTGDVTYTSGSFDGSANVTGTATLANSGVTAGTYNNVATSVTPITVDAKGRITSTGTAVTITPAWSSITSTPTTISGYGITDAYTKTQVDAFLQGLDPKASVVAATTVNITLSAPQTIDGISVVAGDRVLVKNQTTASQNGIYVVAAGSWTRATDMDAWTEVPGSYVFVEKGTTYADTGWVSTADQGGTLDTTAISWVQFAGAGTYTGTAPITISGTAISLANSGVTASSYGSSTAVPVLTIDAFGRVTAASTATISGSLTFTGDVTGSGSTGASTALTLATVNSNVGTFTKVTVNDKGLVTAAVNATTSDISEGTNLYYTDTRARAAHSFTAGSGAYNSTTGVITIPTNTNQLTNGAGFITGNQNISVTGDATGSGTTAITLTLANSGATAGTYNNVTVNAKGLVTSASNVSYLTSYTETSTLANVTARGATTSTVTTFSGGDGSNSSIKLAGYNQRGGAGYHGFLEATNTYASATTPSKYFRIDSSGSLQIVNNAYTATILALTDAGALTIPSTLTASNFSGTHSGTSSGTNTGDQTITLTGDVTGSGTGSFATTLASSGVTAGTYTKVTVDAKGRVTVGASIASADLPTYTGTLTSSQVTTALGFTPYNSTNPSGYLTGTKVDSISATSPIVASSSTGAITLSHASSGVTAGTYNNVTVNATGHVTSASNVTYLTSYSETDTLATVTARGSTTSSQITVDSVLTTNNGNGTNFRVGDDAWIGDINVSNTFRVTGLQDATKGYIVFGNSDTTALGRSGTGALTYGGNTVYHSGNLTNLNQLTNGPGYITGESDTLATVTGRGASTSTAVTLNNKLTVNVTGVNQSVSGIDLNITGTGTYQRAFRVLNSGMTAGDSMIGVQVGQADSNKNAGQFYFYYAGASSTSNRLSMGLHSVDDVFNVFGSGNIQIGSTTDAGYKLGVTGTFNASGAVTQAGNQVLHAGNYTSYSPSLTGSGASGTWSININGNAATATSLGGYTSDGWLRKVGDSTQFQIYGNSRTMIYRTDGNTNPHGGGGYAHIFYYGGSNDNQRMFIINTDGRLYSPYHGWLDTMSVAYASSAGSATTADQIDSWGFVNTGSNSATNADTINSNGISYVQSMSLFAGGSAGTQTDGALYSQYYSSSWQHQIYGDYRTGQLSVRGKNSGTWQAWRTIPTSYVGDSAPSNYNNGDFWWQSSTGKLKICYYDGNSTQWVDAVPIPDTSTFYSKAGGAITGPVVMNSSLTISGLTTATGAIALTNQNLKLTQGDGTGLRVTTAYGYMNLGAQNSSWTHMYADRAFYTNQDWYVNGNLMHHDGNASRARNSSLMYYAGFTLDANTMADNSTGFTYAVNAPAVGPVARFSTGGGYDLWLNAAYTGGNFLYFRTRNGDAGSLNSWKALVSYGQNYAGSLYGTIFYDADNTGYYSDPAGTSNLNAAEINGSWHFISNRNTSSDTPPLQAYSNNGSGAIMSFHRSGQYAVNFGLDSDNVMRIGGWSASTNRWQLDMSGNQWVAGSSRAPIFYDSDDTTYYIDPNSTSTSLNLAGYAYIGKGISSGYYLTLNHDQLWAQGQLHLQYSSGGNINMCNGGGYAYIGGSGTSLRAPIFYDTNDTGYYSDPNSTSRLNRINVNEIFIYSSSPTIHFVDSDERGAAIHNNSNLLYILSSNGTGGESWSQNNGYWPFYINVNNNNATFGGDIWAAGNVTAYSDIKLKENIETIDSPLDKVLKLRGVYYTLKRDESKTRKMGVIAQEVQEVIPEVVILHQDEEDKEGTLAVDYGNIAAILIEAIKEQQKQIEELKAEVKALKG